MFIVTYLLLTTRPVLLTSCTDSEPHNCDVLKVVLDMNSELLQLYKDVPSFPEVFSPLHTNVSRYELFYPHACELHMGVMS